MTPDRLNQALKILQQEMPVPEVLDTPGKAAAEGVPIGTTIMRRQPPQYLPRDRQTALDVHVVRELWLAGLVDLPAKG